ncbi:NAD(P)-binding domain-containing protein, partial [Chloroflexota bacterium]
MPKLGFIGAGTVGTALATRLSDRGYQVVAVSSRSRASAEKLAQAISGCHAVNSNQAVANLAELIFVTTPDDTIGPVVSEIQWHPGKSVVHCSGADSTETLEPARKSGVQVGAFHP